MLLIRRCLGRLLCPLIAFSLSSQVWTSISDVACDGTAALRIQVQDLVEREQLRIAEIRSLKDQLASLGLQANHNSTSYRRRLEEEEEAMTTEEGANAEGAGAGAGGEEAGAEGGEAEGGEAEGEAEGEETEEGEEAEEEEEEEEEIAPVDITLAICLLSFVTIIMTIFWLVNYEDEDMKIYVWTVISQTLSIFIAVLMFTTVDTMAHKFVPSGLFMYCDVVVDLAQLLVWFTAMQVSVAYISGSFEDNPFPDPSEAAVVENKDRRKRRFKSVATLFGHMSGFAFINFGGGIQHMQIFMEQPALMFLVPPVLFVIQISVCRGVRRIRTMFIKNILHNHNMSDHYQKLVGVQGDEEVFLQEQGIKWCLDKWDEETYESENEISGLALSFLFLQAIRYSMTGNMPNNMGIEEEDYIHPQRFIYYMSAVGLVFVVLEILVVIFGNDYSEMAVEPGSASALLRRVLLVLESAMTMGFAWALMYTSKWQITLLLPGQNPNHIISRVILALTLSVIAFFIILVLDWIADSDCTGEKADKAIKGVINGLSILVGFSWEQSFDGAVEVLAESCFKEHPIMAELALTVGVFGIVYPQWRKYILRTLLRLKDEQLEKEQRNRQETTGEEAEK